MIDLQSLFDALWVLTFFGVAAKVCLELGALYVRGVIVESRWLRRAPGAVGWATLGAGVALIVLGFVLVGAGALILALGEGVR